MGRIKLSDEEIAAARTEICRVALLLFARDGYEAVTMRAIAEAFGWSTMKAYRYFASKEQIFVAVRALALVHLSDEIDAGTRAIDDPVERLAASFRAYARFAIANPAEYRLAFETYEQQMAGFPINTNDTLRSWTIAYAAAQKACHLGQLDGDPNFIVHLLWSAVHGLIELDLSKRLLFGKSFDDLVDPVITTIIASFAVAHPGAERRRAQGRP